MENSAHENKKKSFLYKQYTLTRPSLLRNCVVIWKDAYGKIHRDFAESKLIALMRFNYPLFRIQKPSALPFMPFREEPILREVLYLFTIKKYNENSNI